MNNFTITAPKDPGRWNTDPVKSGIYLQGQIQKNKDLAEMLKVLFPGAEIHVAENETWYLPSVSLNKDDYESQIKLTITDNGFLRFVAGGYGHKEWKAVKMIKQGDFHLIDEEKAKAAAQALIDSYTEKQAQKKANQDWRAQKEQKEMKEFSKLRPELEKQGMEFFSVGNGSGVILLSAREQGPQILILGKTVNLKLSKYGNDSVAITPASIPAFIELFAKSNPDSTP